VTRPAPLQGVRVLDLSRVLAGPWCGQLLADYGADVMKVERPGVGDDTRTWGPPWWGGADDQMSAYYLSANRGKRSIAIDIATDEGAALVRRLAGHADILLENYKVGQLAKYGLDHAALSRLNPRLIYCSITGYGQDGPYAPAAGYDFNSHGRPESVTARRTARRGRPQKVGVAVADLFTGLPPPPRSWPRCKSGTTGRGRWTTPRCSTRSCDAGQPGQQLPGGRQDAQAHGQRARQRGAVPGAQDAGWPHNCQRSATTASFSAFAKLAGREAIG
jgi:hypothetical protein